MMFKNMKRRTIPNLQVQRMTDMKIVAGVIVAGWLRDLDEKSGGWLLCNDVYMRYKADRTFQLAADSSQITRALIEYTGKVISRGLTGAKDTAGKYVPTNSEALGLDGHGSHFHMYEFKLTENQQIRVTEFTKENMTEPQKITFSRIREELANV